MKGLILCAGKGTRLYPITLSYPKTLIPVANTPLLHSCIEKLVEQNIAEIGIVLHPSQDSAIKEQIGTGERWDRAITYIYQTEPKGIADAVKQAEPFIGEESFLLLLGDNLLFDSLTELKESIENQGSHAAILLEEVVDTQHYGIAEVSNGRIVSLEEKPLAPKSNLAIQGVYAFTSSIFKAVTHVKPSARGEYEITDAIRWLIEQGFPVTYHLTQKMNMDVGTLSRWLEANRRMLDQLNGHTQLIHETVALDNCEIIAPVSIAQGCVLKDCVIGPYVSISDGSQIEGCRIENSIILQAVHLKQIPYSLKDTVIGNRSVMAGTHASGEVRDQ
ncbi:sugar phosphate nucleotidyltransferase [Paenibacillus sp. SI8]|uniref:sugar phosphate nucleotidyltransferase n=1 Tax=unclassified Paenibacillus TaxID=185978 RepID=UPI00346646EA